MDLYERVVKKEEKISVVGLGYVGLPLVGETRGLPRYKSGKIHKKNEN